MADLSDIQAAQSVKIIGSDSLGSETTPVSSNGNGKLNTAEISNNGGTQGSLTVGTTSVELKVGGSALTDRISATAYNDGSQIVYWGYTSGVTISTGTPIFKKQLVQWSVGPGTSIYLISDTAGQDVRITESA